MTYNADFLHRFRDYLGFSNTKFVYLLEPLDKLLQ